MFCCLPGLKNHVSAPVGMAQGYVIMCKGYVTKVHDELAEIYHALTACMTTQNKLIYTRIYTMQVA